VSKLRQKGPMSRWANRNEIGAGGLLPIIMIGLIVVMVAGSIAASTSFAAKISRVQVDQMSSEIEVGSLLNSFTLDIQKSVYPSTPKSNATISGAGTYRVFYSTSATRPTKSTDSGVTALGGVNVPDTARWLVVDMVTQSGLSQTAVYAYTKKGSANFDTAISWSGPAKLTDTAVKAAPGTEGAVSVVTRETASTATTQALTASGSTIAADVYATYSTAQTGLTAGTIRGNLSSKSKIVLTTNPRVLGNLTSASTISGTGEVAGTRTSSSTALPTPPGSNPTRVALQGTSVALVATDCSTPAKLKAKLESFTATSFITNGDICAVESWATEIKPNAKIIVNSSSTTKAFAISGLKVSGAKGTLGFASNFGLTLTNVNYTDGAAGQFISAGTFTAVSSVLNGAITSVGTTGGALDISKSTVLYSPVDAPNACTVSTCSTPTAWVSGSVHLVRAS